MTLTICNFDGLVGCTHNYAGLSTGNIASINHKNTLSNPQAAALQGLAQMKLVLGSVGIQGFLPPHQKPNFEFLHKHGFGTNEAKALQKAYTQNPQILAAAWSASAMWTANAATITKTDKNQVHITPANLLTMPHRHQELGETAKNLKHIFYDTDYFTHHNPSEYPDEGAANYMPVRGNNGQDYDVFVFSPQKTNYPARQSITASQEIAQKHQCKNPVFLEQSIDAVNKGAFHNDVVAISHDNFIIYHEYAFTNDNLLPDDIIKIKIPHSLLSLEESVKTYLFNMRIVTNKDGDFEIIASTDIQESKNALKTLDFIQENNPKIKQIHLLDLKQSMANGGGAACLRLRVPIVNRDYINHRFLLNDAKIQDLSNFIKAHYRDRIGFDDLQDIDFAYETLRVYQRLHDLIEEVDLI